MTLELSPDIPGGDTTPSFGGLDRLLGFQIRFAHGIVHRDYAAAMNDLGLTQRQIATLWLIDANPGISQVAIAQMLSMERPTMMNIVDRLEESGWVTRRRSKTDRRRQELFLTGKGRATLKSGQAIIAAHERRLFKKFTREELEILHALLRRITGSS